MEQIVTFYLDDTLFGVPILAVREINPLVEMTPVPLAQESFRGLINLRGQVVTVFDPRIMLGFGKREIQNRSRLIIIKTNEELSEVAATRGIKTSDDPVGILVDAIGDVLTTEETEIEAPPANLRVGEQKYVKGIVKLKDQLLVLLHLEPLLANV